MLGINVTYTMKPGEREAFLAALAACRLRETVLEEAGCLGYDYFLSAHDPDRLLLVERWTGRAEQRAHLAQPHMAALAGLKERCVSHTEVVTYEL